MNFQCPRAFVVMTLVILSACRDDTPVPADSAVAVEAPAPPTVPAAVNPGWDSATAGTALLLSVPDNSAAALVVLPLLTDSVLAGSPELSLDHVSGVEVELFDRTGLAGSTSLIAESQQTAIEGCSVWPRGRLAEVPSGTWRTGFEKGTAIPVTLDSLDGMTASDSAFITRELARLASMLAEGGDSTFRGLPFAVRRAYRFSLPSTSVIIGEIVRTIAEEANPRAEHLLLVAERPASGNEGYAAAFHARVAGTEDAVRTSEILGAIRFARTGTPAIIVSFEYEDGGRLALIERQGSRSWRMTWRSAYTGC